MTIDLFFTIFTFLFLVTWFPLTFKSQIRSPVTRVQGLYLHQI